MRFSVSMMRCLLLCVMLLLVPTIVAPQPPPAPPPIPPGFPGDEPEPDPNQRRIEELEQWIQDHPGVFDWNVHNELRHLYGATNLRKSMEHSNIILQHSVMDEYILNILSGWQIVNDTSAARANLLMNAQAYPDLRFIAAACFLQIGDLYTEEGNLEEATSYYLEVAEDNSPDMAQYRILAEERLSQQGQPPTPPSNVQECSNATFIIPHGGNMGWPYMDPGQNVINYDGTIHRGIDIFVGAVGSTVYAPYAGKVVSSPSYFRIRHPDLGVDTYYGYVSGIVPKGSDVKQGDPIGTIQGDHVHFAITQLDPNYSDDQWKSEMIFAHSLDPSSYFNAQLNFFDGTPRSVDSTTDNYNRPVISWCNTAPVGIIRGVVKTPDGNGVSDATVKIEGTTQSRITDYWMGPNDKGNNTTWQSLNQGGYIFSNAPARQVIITANKPGVGSGLVVVTVEASKIIQAPDIILQQNPVPEAPSDISVFMSSGGWGIQVSWTDNSDNEEGFDIGYSPDPENISVKHELVEANQTLLGSDWGLNYDQNGLLPGQTICFQVSAYNAAGTSEPTPWSCITVP